MSDINVNFSINQFNADFSVDPAPNVTMNISDAMMANFYIEGTTSGTVTQVGGTGSGLGFSLSGNVTSAGNLTLSVPSDTALRTSLNIGNVANINLNGNGSQVLAGNGTWVAQGGGVGNVIPGSAIIANSATINGNSVVYIGSPMTLPGIVPGLSYKVTVYGRVTGTTGNAGTVVLQLRSGPNGTISDTLIANVSYLADANTVFYTEYTMTWRSATQVIVNSIRLNGTNYDFQGGTSGAPVTVANPTYLGFSGFIFGPTPPVVNYFLTHAIISPMNLYPGNIAYGTGTVTSVSTTGSGLGFSLTGGPITTSGTLSLTVPSSSTLRTNLNIGNVANINLNGNVSQVLAGDGTWVAQTGGGGGNLTNITYVVENVGLIAAQTGTYNFDVVDKSIYYSTGIATANIIINFRGNAVTTFNSLLANQQSITATYINTTGTNPFGVSSIQIDGISQTIRWTGGYSPPIANSSTQSYTFTIIKTSTTPTYTVLGSMTRYA